MRRKRFAGTLCLAAGGCTDISRNAPKLANFSTRGTPILTRVRASTPPSFRFLCIGSDPSMNAAMERLYNEVSSAGYEIAGNNYAFQNMSIEEKRTFLYPFLGTNTLTVTADLYAYENYPCAECGSSDSAD